VFSIIKKIYNKQERNCISFVLKEAAISEDNRTMTYKNEICVYYIRKEYFPDFK
jgi:hypothetical protein